MTIETKFNIGDEVWSTTTSTLFVNGDFKDIVVPLQLPLTISMIQISESNLGRVIMYGFTNYRELRPEDKVFTSKDELNRYCNERITEISEKR